MAVGEYIATKSQEEVFEREMALEREHLTHHRQRELDELKQMFEDTGLNEPLLTQLVEAYDADDEALMQIMAALEFGIVDDSRRSPFTAAFASGGLFIAGSLPSLLPFVFVDDVTTGLIWAGILSGIGLFGLGAGKTYVTGTNPITSGLENLIISTVGAVASFGIGRAYDLYVG
jgi:VIT1/CCC1 family predicted Fe2+/Mn2+ transporter